MLKKISLFFVLICSLALCQFNELLPIPAFYVASAGRVEKIVEQAKTYKFSPISTHEYLTGVISTPKNMSPFILITGTQNNFITVNAFENKNLPSYHTDFDPIEKVKAYNLSALDFAVWVSYNKAENFYLSNGQPRVIEITKNDLNKLFTYAPSDNMQVEIPGNLFTSQKTPYSSKKERWKAKKPAIHGLHMTWDGVNSEEKINKLSAQLKKSKMDSVVIDFKVYFINIQNRYYKTYDDFMKEDNAKIIAHCQDLQKSVSLLKKNNIKVSLRIVTAMDDWASKVNSDMLLWDKSTNTAWKDHRGVKWMDLFSPETIRYYKKVVGIALMFDPEEIQLDYIRYPTEGHIENAISRAGKNIRHYKALDNFLKEMVKQVDAKNTAFTADIFGIVLWENKATNEQLGQNVITFMRYCDAVLPMIYPSHFHKGFEGIPAPGDAPYEFNKRGATRFRNLTASYPYYTTLMIPWLQAFKYLSPTYSPNYVKEEVRAMKECGMDGFIAWNAANNYDIWYKGLEISQDLY